MKHKTTGSRAERKPSPPCPHKWESHEEVEKLEAELSLARKDRGSNVGGPTPKITSERSRFTHTISTEETQVKMKVGYKQMVTGHIVPLQESDNLTSVPASNDQTVTSIGTSDSVIGATPSISATEVSAEMKNDNNVVEKCEKPSEISESSFEKSGQSYSRKFHSSSNVVDHSSKVNDEDAIDLKSPVINYDASTSYQERLAPVSAQSNQQSTPTNTLSKVLTVCNSLEKHSRYVH